MDDMLAPDLDYFADQLGDEGREDGAELVRKGAEEVFRLQADARRIDWLVRHRMSLTAGNECWVVWYNGVTVCDRPTLRGAIDEARAKWGKKGVPAPAASAAPREQGGEGA